MSSHNEFKTYLLQSEGGWIIQTKLAIFYVVNISEIQTISEF